MLTSLGRPLSHHWRPDTCTQLAARDQKIIQNIPPKEHKRSNNYFRNQNLSWRTACSVLKDFREIHIIQNNLDHDTSPTRHCFNVISANSSFQSSSCKLILDLLGSWQGAPGQAIGFWTPRLRAEMHLILLSLASPPMLSLPGTLWRKSLTRPKIRHQAWSS